MLCSHSHRHYSWQILRILRENFTLLFAKTEGELHCIGKNVLSYLARVQTFLFQVPLLHHLIYIPKRTVSKRKKSLPITLIFFSYNAPDLHQFFSGRKREMGSSYFYGISTSYFLVAQIVKRRCPLKLLPTYSYLTSSLPVQWKKNIDPPRMPFSTVKVPQRATSAKYRVISCYLDQGDEQV